MGNVKSRNDFSETNRKITRNLSQPLLSTAPSTFSLTSSTAREQVHQQLQRHIHHQGGEYKWTTTVTAENTTNTSAVGGRLVEIVDDKATNGSSSKTAKRNSGERIQQKPRRQRQQKAADSTAALAPASTEQERRQQQGQQLQQQRIKQASFWSLGSLNWNLSYSGHNSYKQRQKSLRKSFSSTQNQRLSKKTQWHRPVTSVIFSSHFKDSSRNGEFQIDHLVAKGAFGVVFKVVAKNSDRHNAQQQQEKSFANDIAASTNSTPVYALKVLKKYKIISENSVQQIKDEADIQKLCGHHPFIVKQLDLWQNRHHLHILSEFIPNGELLSKISTFPLSLMRIYLAEIALALDFLHNAGVIYRDAKPENILLTSDYHLKLTDFGLSKWLKLGRTTKTICGTFQYMAPEILRGEPYTHSVDWWSLGIIVCQMLTKKCPDIRQFITVALPKQYREDYSVDNISNAGNAEEEETSRLKDIQEYLPEEVQSITHEGRDVLQRLLEFDGQKRLHSVRALQRIAMYKDFRIEAQHILKIRPLDVIAANSILLYGEQDQSDQYDVDVEKAFKDF